MKRHGMNRLFGLLLVSAMLLALAACGGSSGGAGGSQSSAPPADTSAPAESTAPAASFPTKTMTIVCPYGAGGGTDLALRILAECGQDTFGQVINVENKTGGSGTVGLTEALNAAADGYTLATASVDLITLPLLGLAPAEVTRDAFDSICVINGEPAAIIVKSDACWNSIDEFLDEAKANPGKIQLANAGMGNIWHLAAIGIELESGASFNHVPFSDGAASAIAAVLGGHVDAVICSAAEAASNIASGDMKVLAVANTDRLEAYPDVPTFQEKGVDLTVVALRGLCVNADAPEDVKQVLRDGFDKVIHSDACRQKVEEANMTYMPLNAQETDEILDSMAGNFEKIIAAYQESAG